MIFKSIKETQGLILKKRKKIIQGATVVKFQSKVYKQWYLNYFRAPGINQGVRRSGNFQGTRIFRFEPLFFSQNWTNIEKPPKNSCILDVFEDSSILTEKQQPKPKNLSALKFFSSFDTLLDPRGAEVRNEMIREANTPMWINSHSVVSASDQMLNQFQILLNLDIKPGKMSGFKPGFQTAVTNLGK